MSTRGMCGCMFCDFINLFILYADFPFFFFNKQKKFMGWGWHENGKKKNSVLNRWSNSPFVLPYIIWGTYFYTFSFLLNLLRSNYLLLFTSFIFYVWSLYISQYLRIIYFLIFFLYVKRFISFYTIEPVQIKVNQGKPTAISIKKTKEYICIYSLPSNEQPNYFHGRSNKSDVTIVFMRHYSFLDALVRNKLWILWVFVSINK